MSRENRVLIVAAHPDDEILGCGGTVARLVQEGWEAHTLILGEGITSRDIKRDPSASRDKLATLHGQAVEANKIIGVKETYFGNFPDNRFDECAHLDIVKVIEEYKDRLSPSIIFTHYEGDLNVDHQIANRCVQIASRPMEKESTAAVYAFEVLSSTEWRYPSRFSPNTFWDISDTLRTKCMAMDVYKSEVREYPHPRSLKGIEISAKTWGMKIGVPAAEAFQALRVVH